MSYTVKKLAKLSGISIRTLRFYDTIGLLLKKAGIIAKMKKRFKVTTKANPKAIPAPNLLQQDFTAEKPNQRWVADFTYVATQEGWLYVATVLDLFSRRIVGLAMSDRMTTDLVSNALQQALTHRQPPANLIHHSDRGCQYTSNDFQALLKKHHIIASMSGVGNCYDNATQERKLINTIDQTIAHLRVNNHA
jgi:putative transposase